MPTFVIVFALIELGQKLGVLPQSQDKARYISERVMQGLESMRKANVKIGFGTDLLGESYVQQCREFTIRHEVFSPLEILRQVTSTNAELLLQKDKLGCVAPGAHADLLVVGGDPLKDIELLAGSGKNLLLIMRAGEIIQNALR